MLEIKDLYWSFSDGEPIINGISCKTKGRLTVITGPNGGGKTTLAKLIAGVEKPTSGQILFNGEEITELDITDRAKKGIAYAFQQPVRFKGLTVRDLLELSADGKLDHTALCDLLAKVGLCAEEYINREMSSALSGGEAKRIEIATVLARKAKLSVFDEPEAGIDLWSFSRLVETFEDIRGKAHGAGGEGGCIFRRTGVKVGQGFAQGVGDGSQDRNRGAFGLTAGNLVQRAHRHAGPLGQFLYGPSRLSAVFGYLFANADRFAVHGVTLLSDCILSRLFPFVNEIIYFLV